MTTLKIPSIARTVKFALVATAAAGTLALGLAGPAQASGNGPMYGDPVAAEKYWQHQKYDDCAIMSSAEVVGQITGKLPSERSIVKVAQTTPSVAHSGSIYVKPADKNDPNSGMGTDPDDLPTLLAHYGIHADNGNASGMEALERNLGGGHAVIVVLNAEMIWNQPIQNKGKNGQPRADHAVAVTGVDTTNGVVHLNDSGSEKGKNEQIPMAVFVKAWATSGNFMTVTRETHK
ncbi:C39 family peptidase [Mycobacterium vicinigordonae]|uniref:C39 family peptidase n=1 Tax=Mycobacterium vicinigordonae TaxID=1719132 RepID=A0A7D6IQ56_9MYCO|nr:C39 family peptidase [Mycobacterium vicinigordonae]QLL06199.1 C39 family peptidase [Mycobacterium vicinigordonae]